MFELFFFYRFHKSTLKFFMLNYKFNNLITKIIYSLICSINLNGLYILLSLNTHQLYRQKTWVVVHHGWTWFQQGQDHLVYGERLQILLPLHLLNASIWKRTQHSWFLTYQEIYHRQKTLLQLAYNTAAKKGHCILR